MKEPCVYILASKKKGTIYVGSTGNLVRRVEEHKSKVDKGFTEKYNVNKLVYFEKHITIEDAISREKQIKKWKRDWKIKLIDRENPDWKDLSVYFQKNPDNIKMVEILSGKARGK